MMYEILINSSSVFIKVIMPGSCLYYEHTGFDDFLGEIYQGDEEDNFDSFSKEEYSFKAEQIESFIQNSFEEMITITVYEDDIVYFDDSDCEKFEFKNDMDL